MDTLITSNQNLIEDIRNLITIAKTRVAKATNSHMTLLYWHIGQRIRRDIIQSARADYGTNAIHDLSKVLLSEYGRGFSEVNLSYMIKFYDQFDQLSIVQTVSEKLTWSHIVELLPLKDQAQREFYAYMTIESRWTVRDLRHQIHKMTYERTIANQDNNNGSSKSILTNEMQLTTNPNFASLILKDPYVLDFLDLPDLHYENDLEQAILREIEKFILELGTGFSFVARQKRMTIDNDHFYLDLLFYNRKLKRMVAVELKNGRFKAEYKGQMELYLRYLQKYETYDDELPPIGIILCTSKSSHQIELLNMTGSGIHVAEYWTDLPPREIFERKIQEIVLNAKGQLHKSTDDNKKI